LKNKKTSFDKKIIEEVAATRKEVEQLNAAKSTLDKKYFKE
jgi:hypothetical protein